MWMLVFVWWGGSWAWAAPREETADVDKDGKIDRWLQYDEKGAMKRDALDTNKDGKPDYWREFVKGRALIIREKDKNLDGKADYRSMDEWQIRKIPTVPGQPAIQIPGYVSLWREEDTDFDGKIDVYKERGNAGLKKNRIGQPI